MKLHLTINLEDSDDVAERATSTTDAVNETLNELARDDVLNDDFDNAWAWSQEK